MAKIVEPPVLTSRILAFMLAASVVVLGVLVVTLIKMVPLERPEVFFVSASSSLSNVSVKGMEPDPEMTRSYEEGFVREYIIARNTLYQNTETTRNNWTRVIKPWSSPDVFANLTKTNLYQVYTQENQLQPVECNVSFSSVSRTSRNWVAEFNWICKNNSGQSVKKNYTIVMKLKSDLSKDGPMEDLSRLRVNPLGTQVISYEILDNNRSGAKGEDPLNSDWTDM